MVSQFSDSDDTAEKSEKFDAAAEKEKSATLIWNHIKSNDDEGLKEHLEQNKDKFDVTKIFNPTGFTPIHLAAYKSQLRICEILIEFALNNGNDPI